MKEKGVWRTISGRKVFIKEGQSLSDAMKESGKFNKHERKDQKLQEEKDSKHKKLKDKYGHKYDNLTEEEMLEKLKEINEKLENPMKRINSTEEEKRLMREERKYLRDEYENRTKEDREKQRDIEREKQYKIEKERFSKITQKEMDELKRTTLTQDEINEWNNKIEKEIKNLENSDLYISADDLNSLVYDDKSIIKRYSDAESLVYYDKINKEEYQNYVDSYERYTEKIDDILYEKIRNKGYEYEELPGGKRVYSQRIQVQTGYNQMLDYLDKRKIKYEISRSTNAGIVPSIYIKDKEDNIIARIGNHRNSNTSYLEKVFDNSDYLTWKKNIIDKIDLYQ